MVLLYWAGLLVWRWSPALWQVHERKAPQEFRRLDGVRP